MFDRDFNPKPAYFALKELLLDQKRNLSVESIRLNKKEIVIGVHQEALYGRIVSKKRD
jgi:hypothetical protein